MAYQLHKFQDKNIKKPCFHVRSQSCYRIARDSEGDLKIMIQKDELRRRESMAEPAKEMDQAEQAMAEREGEYGCQSG